MRTISTLRRVAALVGAAGLALALAPPASATDDSATNDIATNDRATNTDAATDRGDVAKVTRSGAADAGEYPAQVALVTPGQADNRQGQFCGGTHVLPGWVLTAAHCVDVGGGVLITPDVVLGTNRLDGSGVRVATTLTVVHPQWSRSAFVNDIALLRLATPVAVPFQRLVVAGLEFLENPGPGISIGWGGLNREDQGSQAFPLELREGVVPIIDDATCQSRLLQFGAGLGMTLPDTQVCAGTGTITSEPEEADACRGDSGGPLLVPVPGGGTRQAGVVSYGPTCGFSPTVYTGVLDFIAFIEATTGQQVATFPDIPGDIHEPNIERIAHFGLTAGDTTGRYRPGAPVSRGQMASFIGRALGLAPIPDVAAFSDIAGNAHQGYINALAALGIAGGFSDGTFRPSDSVNRGQMASFLVRAFGASGTASGPFSDVAGSTHEANINTLAASGVAGGFPDGTYRPGSPVFRGQMATFLARAFYAAPRA